MAEKTKLLLPVLPLRDIVVFPGMIVPLFVGREKSIKALEESLKHDSRIVLVAQKNSIDDMPVLANIYDVGVMATIMQLLKLPDGSVKVLVEASERVVLHDFFEDSGAFYHAHISTMEPTMGNELEVEALNRSILKIFLDYAKAEGKIPTDMQSYIQQVQDPARLLDLIVPHLNLKNPDKQLLLSLNNIQKRLEAAYVIIQKEVEVVSAENKIRSRVKRQMEKSQKEYYLNEQLKAIQKELGEAEELSDIDQLAKKFKSVKFSKEAKERVESELKKLRQVNPMSAEATVIRNYLDWIAGLPWKKFSAISYDLAKAEKVLNRDHFAMEKVKERILEYLAVQQRTKSLKGSILCFVGPPGVGKTSLARAIAEATGRNFVRLSLGGVRDESEIRGHRRTYIGAMPGKILQLMKKAGTSNPLFLLDEIDKMGMDIRGDPASALLEVLDPEQNKSFSDHYLEVDYDLSNVMFIATANSLNMQRPLLDRMEIIRLSGYTDEEKMEIATKHLVPKQLKEHGLKKSELDISPDALRDLIHYYTREAGVRSLEREIANIARKTIKEILMKKRESVHLTTRNVSKYAGVKKYLRTALESEHMVGITTGLAYTEVGGETLTIEAVRVPGKGSIKTTGKLGDVMQESAQAAFSFILSRAKQFGITTADMKEWDIHLHVPEGATPKDGPSAGIAMCTSIVSLLTNIPVRHNVAMTGEITLRGRVLAIGGLKEKLLAALRAGIDTVLIPEENTKDIAELPAPLKKHLTIIPVSDAMTVLQHALTHMPAPSSPGDDLGKNATDKGTSGKK